MASSATSLMMMVSQSSRKCCRCTFASSLGSSQNGLACTIMISPVWSLKFLSPMLTVGLVGTLVTTGMENSWSDF
jgi:hypothetical protein